MRAVFHHRVVDHRDPRDPYSASAVEIGALRAQAVELARHWRVLSLAEVADHLGTGRALPRRSVHLSFDDGYRDNLVAAEIFEAHQLPWTLFVVADAVLDGFVPWYVRLAGALAATPAPIRWDGVDYDLRRPADVARFKGRAKRAVMAAPARRHLAVLDGILAGAGLGVPEGAAWPFLSAGELRDLAGRGVEIGNHSASHPNLARCGPAELTKELAGSQARLQDALGQPVRFLAYPDGRCNRAVVEAAGLTHELAMATWTSRQPMAPLRMRRFPAGATLDELRDVLGPGYPTRYRARRAKWAARRWARRVGR